MLCLELCGQSFNKTAHREALLLKLNQRTKGAVEFKHQNISAALLQLGLPYIRGYKPMSNFQGVLLDVISSQLARSNELTTVLQADISAPVVEPEVFDILKSHRLPKDHRAPQTKQIRKVELPPMASEIRAEYKATEKRGNRDYLAEEAANRMLGLSGEKFILRYEKARLTAANCEKLAEKIEHTSIDQGDGAGFDILSYETNGAERLIEVKTTKYGEYTPFFVSKNEVAVSRKEPDRYHVYRLFEFRTNPSFFVIPGAIETSCDLVAITFLAKFRESFTAI